MGSQLFLSSSVPASSISSLYGKVSPLPSNCPTCSAGSQNVYPNSNDANIVASEQKAIGAFTCSNMCICATDGVCYMIKTPTTSAAFYPFCTGGTCVTYVLIDGAQDSDGFLATDGSGMMFTVGQQFPNPTTTTRFPVTQPNAYMQARSTGCNGCPVQTCS
ncbi:hypothetical protein QR680_015808 [Steinernema hermaphroditum]|uniref:Uncharacterized protein n=1 Tax=Steinernema hermaphroditum TaxID=289476 RepID=A0AA39H9A0_9BILA|nr:hypothetical protein QR680_015808 [Steinernema hermaphroditum]